jgi:hypothetical protein
MIDMENQKPSGRRPVRRYEKPQGNEVNSRRPAIKPVVRSAKMVSNVKHKAIAVFVRVVTLTNI